MVWNALSESCGTLGGQQLGRQAAARAHPEAPTGALLGRGAEMGHGMGLGCGGCVLGWVRAWAWYGLGQARAGLSALGLGLGCGGCVLGWRGSKSTFSALYLGAVVELAAVQL
eukprot:136386-Chlamydomonas_euryale.AAC.1